MNAMDRIGIEAAVCDTPTHQHAARKGFPKHMPAAEASPHVDVSKPKFGASTAADSKPPGINAPKIAFYTDTVTTASRSAPGRNIPKHTPTPEQVSPGVHKSTVVSDPIRPPLAMVGHWKELVEEGFSMGLARALASESNFAFKTWIVDNSGSMVTRDGHRIVETSDRRVEGQRVTRWEELRETVLYHAELASILRTPTIFQLLNDPGERVGKREWIVGKEGCNRQEEMLVAKSVMQRTKPMGVTPLTSHVVRIEAMIREMKAQLDASGERVAVVIATDGLPTDVNGNESEEIRSDFVYALKAMEGLPIWLVIRLCTDEPKVRDFYNQLDSLLELSMDVIDDFAGEAKEVYRYNKWLNYGLPLQRCRELGFHEVVFDALDERKLELAELKSFCGLLFGSNPTLIPDPTTNWKDFMAYVEDALIHERLQWNPITEKMAPWINLRVLNNAYGQGKCTIM